MASNKKDSNAVGGKTARACDSCIRKRARWYCAADDAFLCQACDASVHSANPLAGRHERVRLKTSSFKCSEKSNSENSVPSWHKGFTRKARTPRNGKQSRKSEELTQDSHSPVPQLGSGETSNEESEEQLVYRVPILDIFASQLSTSTTNSHDHASFSNGFNEFPNTMQAEFGQEVRNLHGILPSEMELDQFSADVVSLLGKGFNDESFDMESLGLLDCKGNKFISMKWENELVKIESGEDNIDFVKNCESRETDLAREAFELNFDYDSPLGEEVTKVGLERGVLGGKYEEEKSEGGDCNKRKLLRLDCEGVIAAWANQRSPWTTGDRPEVDPNDCWPHCLGSCGISSHQYSFGESWGVISGGHSTIADDGGREARVSRYREKRRRRLFSKKIRYEVRKLNAEKRPRMKGRFVKRTTNAGFVPLSNSAFPLLGK